MDPNAIIPKKLFFTKGVGVDKDPLFSFEKALREAGIEKYNLVPVSSIIPPNIEIIQKEEGIKLLKPGQIVFCVLSRFTSNETGKEIYAEIGYAIPEDKNYNGYISEYSGYIDNIVDAGEIAKRMLETEYNIKVKVYNSIISRAKVGNMYTTVVAAAVFIY